MNILTLIYCSCDFICKLDKFGSEVVKLGKKIISGAKKCFF